MTWEMDHGHLGETVQRALLLDDDVRSEGRVTSPLTSPERRTTDGLPEKTLCRREIHGSGHDLLSVRFVDGDRDPELVSDFCSMTDMIVMTMSENKHPNNLEDPLGLQLLDESHIF